jgi:hypothetical protein
MTRLWWCLAAAVLVAAGFSGGPCSADDSLLSRMLGATPVPPCDTFGTTTINNPCEWDGTAGWKCNPSTQLCPMGAPIELLDKVCEVTKGDYCWQLKGCVPRDSTQSISGKTCFVPTP